MILNYCEGNHSTDFSCKPKEMEDVMKLDLLELAGTPIERLAIGLLTLRGLSAYTNPQW